MEHLVRRVEHLAEEVELLAEDLEGQALGFVVAGEEVDDRDVALLAVAVARPMRCSMRCGFHGRS